jgi:hypothetical protein
MSVLFPTQTRAQWRTANPTLSIGEAVYESDTRKIKIGDGTTEYVNLGYAWVYFVAPGTVVEGDPTGYDAIVVSGVAVVANNVMPPGLRMASAWTLANVAIRVGSAPEGDDLEIVIRANGSAIGTYVLPAGDISVVIPSTHDFAEGDIVTYDITNVGSDFPGSAIAVTLY